MDVQTVGVYSWYRQMYRLCPTLFRAVRRSTPAVGRGVSVYRTVFIDYYRTLPVHGGFPEALMMPYRP